MDQNRDLLWRQLAWWSLLPESGRDTLGLPASNKAWSAAKGLNRRTVDRWFGDPGFVELRDQCVKVMLTWVDDPDRAERLESGTDEESDFRRVKDQLVSQAMAGDPRSQDLYFKTFGKAFVEAESERLSGQFSELDDDELTNELLSLVGERLVVSWLRDVRDAKVILAPDERRVDELEIEQGAGPPVPAGFDEVGPQAVHDFPPVPWPAEGPGKPDAGDDE